MIDPNGFLDCFIDNDISFFAGVPDSLLKHFCSSLYKKDNVTSIVAANEGNAIGLAIGHYLASSNPALVYMQNSGLGNALNPLVSLADSEIYGIPMVLLIGWRGELEEGVQKKDEPQHSVQGRITLNLLDIMNISYEIVDSNTDYQVVIEKAVQDTKVKQQPVALVVRKNSFDTCSDRTQKSEYSLSREDAIEAIVSSASIDDIFVSTTGMASRELFEIREARNENHDKDFLTVGGMGHASQIAAGIALTNKKQRVFCLDGDGALLMHMGGLTVSSSIENFVHILLNNEAHDSVGGQPTNISSSDVLGLAKSVGYENVLSVCKKEEIESALNTLKKQKGSAFVEVKCKKGARSNLGRPTNSPVNNMISFKKNLED